MKKKSKSKKPNKKTYYVNPKEFLQYLNNVLFVETDVHPNVGIVVFAALQ